MDGTELVGGHQHRRARCADPLDGPLAHGRVHPSWASAWRGGIRVDRNVPSIGDELATARALADLAHQLIDSTVGDIEAVTHARAHLTQ